MRELSLFTGAGGGLLGSKLLDWKHIGYVEINEYCQRVIRQRINDGILNEAPIFSDIRAFINQGYADAYQGMVDVVTGGFPCKPWSTAARGRTKVGEDFWPEMLEVVRRVKPAYVFAENVSNQATKRAKIDLESAGYKVRRARISASAVGAPHRRPREWMVAYIDGDGESFVPVHDEVEIVRCLPKVAWWDKDAPEFARVVSGDAHRMDRVRAIGNGQVPAVVRAAWELLAGVDKTA